MVIVECLEGVACEVGGRVLPSNIGKKNEAILLLLIDLSVRAEDCVRTIAARSWPAPCPHPLPYNTALDQADLKT